MSQIHEKPIRQRRTNQQILQLLGEYEISKFTVREFCRQHHISIGNFHKWKSRYGKKAGSKYKHSGFAAIDIVHTSSRLFAEVGAIKIYQVVPASFLKDLLP